MRKVVQVGGAYTPPEFRVQRGVFAAVAWSLLEERESGARRSMLFAGVNRQSAIRAYTALGCEVVGDFGLVIFG